LIESKILLGLPGYQITGIEHSMGPQCSKALTVSFLFQLRQAA
jgi:hypothetical protein